MTHITKTAALRALKKAVDKKGADHIYERVDLRGVVSAACAYIDPDTRQPSCIVGHVLVDLGVDPDRLALPGINNLAFNQTLLERLSITASPAALVILRQAQYAQDCGEPWGDALAQARAAARRFKGVK